MIAGSAEARTAASDLEIVATRELAAPRELVWAAWTEPAHVARWWGPRGFTNTIHEMDVRPGGVWRLTMHGPDGKDYPNEHRYVEVVRPERIVMEHVTGPRFRLTATFEARGAGTVVTMRSTFASAADRDVALRVFHADEGLRENAERLGEYLGAGPRGERAEVAVTRVFDAPRALVFEAWTRPEHLSRWWPPRGFTLPACEVDFRPGGAYRMVMRGPDGAEYPFHGVYRDVVPPARLVFSAVIGPGAGDALLTTVTFDEEGGKTRVTVRQTVPASAQAARGQEQGWTETLENLGAHVARLREGGARAVGASDPARELVLTRTFDAPRALVFAAWTDPAHLPRWWGPKGFTARTQAIDVRPGGTWRYEMTGPDGAAFSNRVVFEEIARPERLVLAVDSGVDGDPERFHAVITFEEVAGGTRLTHRTVFPTAALREKVVALGAVEGAESSFRKLADHLDGLDAPRGTVFVVPPGEPVFYGRRVLDAPRALVWEAVTRPEHVARWYGPRATAITRCEVDARPGGAWRVEMRTPDGATHGFGGVHREVVPPERIVRTWGWDGAPGAESVETMTLGERGGRTVLTMKAVHASVENRDAHVQHGMEEGAREAMERLAEVVAALGSGRR